MALISSKPTQWKLPAIGLGCAAWMPPFPSIPQAQAAELVGYVNAHGAGFFDTSPLYGRGKSERWLGEALQGIPRDHYFISSKAGYVLHEEEQARRKWLRTEWSRENILHSVDASLKRLGTDYIDVVHLHDPDCCPEDALKYGLPALVELREQGVIRAVGAGMNQSELLMEFAESGDFDCFLLAGRYTLLDQGALPLLDRCQQKGIALFLGGVYNTGILATGSRPGARYGYRPAPPEIIERVQKMEAVCERYSLPLRAAALQFSLAHPAVKSLVIGAQTTMEYQQALDGLEVAIPADFWSELMSQGLIALDARVPASGSIRPASSEFIS